MIRNHRVLVLAVLATLVSCCAANAAAGLDTTREIVQANEAAVVTVELVLESEMSYKGESHKEERETSGTAVVIDESGLAVTSLSQIDPTSLEDFYGERDFSINVRVVDAKIKQGDGTETPAQVVLRDRDLDLAFIKPKSAPDKPFQAIDLENSVTPHLLDELVTISRLGSHAGRCVAAELERVQAVIEKPRRLYVVEGALGLGCPAFTHDGKVAGVTVLRCPKKGDATSFNMFSNMMCVVVPTETLQRAAKQAMEIDASN